MSKNIFVLDLIQVKHSLTEVIIFRSSIMLQKRLNCIFCKVYFLKSEKIKSNGNYVLVTNISGNIIKAQRTLICKLIRS
jgi:hypothetical protein